MRFDWYTSVGEMFARLGAEPIEPVFPLVYCERGFFDFLTTALPGDFFAVLASEKGKTLGFLPWLRFSHDRAGAVYNSLPWFGSHGGCYMDKAAPPETRRGLLQAFQDVLADDPSFLTATLSLHPEESRFRMEYDAAWPAAIVDERRAQILELPSPGSTPDDLMARFSSNTRKQVWKSLRQDFVLADGDNEAGWKFLYATHVENMRAIGGRPKLAEHLDALRFRLPGASRRLTLACLGTEPVAALLSFRCRPSIEYVMPVIKHEFRPHQPLSFIIYHEMLQAVTEGFSYWNFGGTWQSQVSLHRFKRGWGAMDRQYLYYTLSGPGYQAVSASCPADELMKAFPFYFVYPFTQQILRGDPCK